MRNESLKWDYSDSKRDIFYLKTALKSLKTQHPILIRELW